MLNFTMSARAYMSNILKVWTPTDQQELLDSVGEKLMLYRDELRPGERKLKAPEAMVERAAMLRPTGRKGRDETIYIACLGLLAWDLRDLLRCLASAQARGATIVALNTGRRIEPSAGAGRYRRGAR